MDDTPQQPNLWQSDTPVHVCPLQLALLYICRFEQIDPNPLVSRVVLAALADGILEREATAAAQAEHQGTFHAQPAQISKALIRLFCGSCDARQ